MPSTSRSCRSPWAGIWGATALLFDDLGDLVPLLIGAVLVVSGPTVVLALLSFVRPAPRLRSLLMVGSA